MEFILRQRLADYPLYNEDNRVFALSRNGNIYLNWQTGTQNVKRGSYFDVQITGKMFYILHIEIEKKHRGKGLGLTLYKILEHIAEDFHCDEIEMTPVGTTYNGETRMEYVVRKLDYVRDPGKNHVVSKKIVRTRYRSITAAFMPGW